MRSIFYSVVTIVTIVLFSVGCEKYTYIDYAKLAADEKELLADYYSTNLFMDTLNAYPDTIDKRNSTGLMYFSKQKGDGDSVLYGKKVGVYYTRQVLYRDSLGNVAISDVVENNYLEANPLIFTIGDKSVFTGFDQAVRYMRMNGKSKVIVPSTLGSTNIYQTYIFDLELVYIGKY